MEKSIFTNFDEEYPVSHANLVSPELSGNIITPPDKSNGLSPEMFPWQYNSADFEDPQNYAEHHYSPPTTPSVQTPGGVAASIEILQKLFQTEHKLPPTSATSSSGNLSPFQHQIEPQFRRLQETDVLYHLQTKTEQNMTKLEEVTTASITEHLQQWSSYNSSGGIQTLVSTLSVPRQVKQFVARRLQVSVLDLDTLPSSELYQRMVDKFTTGQRTPLKELVEESSRLKLVTLTVDNVNAYETAWLKLFATYPRVQAVPEVEKVKRFLAGLPSNVVTEILTSYSKPVTVDAGFDILLQLAVAFETSTRLHGSLTKSPSGWRPSRQGYHEPGSMAAASVQSIPLSASGYILGQPFTPSWNQCWHCNLRHDSKGQCTNPTDPSTHCGACGNLKHPRLHKDLCPKWGALQLIKGIRAAAVTANMVPMSMYTELKAQMDAITEAYQVRRLAKSVVLPIIAAVSDACIIDSGCNGIFLNSATHSDTIPEPTLVPQTVETANGTISNIETEGTILDRPAFIPTDFPVSLIGVHPFCSATSTSLPNVAIFTAEEMVGISLTPEIRIMLDKVEQIALRDNLIKLKVLQQNGLYLTTIPALKHTYAGASYYQTVKTNNVKEVVQFFHESWAHANEQQMTWIVQNEIFTSIPLALTVAAIHKHFPTCVSCVKGNLSVRPLVSNPIDRVVAIGEELAIDIKHWKNADGGPCKSFSGSNLSLTATDYKSKYMFGFWLQNKQKLLGKFKELRLKVQAKGRELLCIRVDNAFVTKEIIAWCLEVTPKITIKPCIPYEHGPTAIVERDHRNLQDGVVAALDQPHLGKEYIAYAYFDTLDKHNMMPSRLNPTTSPQILWDGHKIDLKESPILPFGCVVLGHIPLPLQTALSGRAFEAICVGRADGYRGGVKLYNTATGRVVIRRTFKVMGPEPYISPILKVPVLYEAIDHDVEDHPTVYGADMGSSAEIVSTLSLNPPPTNEFDVQSSSSPTVDRELPVASVSAVPLNESAVTSDLPPPAAPPTVPLRVHFELDDSSAPHQLLSEQVEIDCIVAHAGPPTKTSKLFFQIKWKGREVLTWKKYSEIKDCSALDAYILLHPALEILNTPSPLPLANNNLRQISQHRYETRAELKARIQAHRSALRTGVYCAPERPSSWDACFSKPTEELLIPSVASTACALPNTMSHAKQTPSRRTQRRHARYANGSSAAVKVAPPVLPSRRALLAAQLLEQQKPSYKALVAAQLVQDEATYDPLLLANIAAGSYSKDLLEKAMILLTEVDTRTASLPLTATSVSTSPLPSNPSLPVPLSVTQALASLEWESWMSVTADELASMREMCVWHTPAIPFKDIPRNRIIPSKIIFARKYNADGTFQKYKARLCARGDRWQDALGVETYAGTVKSESIKLLLGIAAEEDMEISCVDVATAFLHSPLPPDQVIYMRRPIGLTDADMPEIVELDKCLYGLPQASNRFREHSDNTLRALGFTPTISDPCVYVLYKNGGRVYALIHVDDIGLIGSTTDLLSYVKKGLSATYTLKETDMSNYLGMHIVRDRPHRSITLYQTGYIASVLEKYASDIPFLESPPSTPMLTVTGIPAQPSLLLSTPQIVAYQGMVGSLMYLASQTRPDILYAVCAHARYSKSPTVDNREGVIRILQYIKNTPNLGLRLHSGEGIVLYATVDASYACHTDLKSHTGCTLHLGRTSGSVFSLSKKQTVTADSSTVAELIAAHLAAHEIMWARNFLLELGFPQLNPTTLFEDNLSTISLIVNKGNGQRSKHINLRYNFVREQVVEKVLAMIHLSGMEMTSDILTKPLGPTAFLHLRPKLLGMAAVMSRKQLTQLVTDCSSLI